MWGRLARHRRENGDYGEYGRRGETFLEESLSSPQVRKCTLSKNLFKGL